MGDDKQSTMENSGLIKKQTNKPQRKHKGSQIKKKRPIKADYEGVQKTKHLSFKRTAD